MEASENILFDNHFGKVTDKRIVLKYKSGTEDIPLSQVTSVSYKHHRNYVFVIGSIIIGLGSLVALFAGLDNWSGAEVILILSFVVAGILSGIANWIGHHKVQISAGGKDRKSLKAEMSKTKEGREFVEAVKKAVIR